VLPTVFDEPCLYISHTVVTHACRCEEVGEAVRTSTGEKQQESMALLGVVKLVALVFLAVFSASLHQQVGVGESSSS